MRSLRNFTTNRCYHLISRIAHRSFFLDDGEKTRLVSFLWRAAEFSGITLIAYCIMTNHFHVVAYVPDREELSDEEVLRRIRILYSGTQLAEKLKEWNAAKAAGPSSVARLKAGYCRRMCNASEFMKTLKQHCTMSFNGRRDHSGTMWESRFRVRVCEPEEIGVLLKWSGYVDANPVKAGLVDWPDRYRWCSFAAASAGDPRAVAGYDFIFSVRGRSWDELRPLEEMSVREALSEIARRKEESASLAEGLSVDARKRDLVVERRYRRLDAEPPQHVPHLVEQGSDKVAFDLLRLLSEGEMRPSDLRERLGVASRSYFTLRYLSPLVASGYVEMTDPSHPRSSAQSYRLTARGRKIVL